MEMSPARERPATVAHLGVDARAAFILRTYLHLAAAIAGFTAIEVALFQTGLARTITRAVAGTSWLLVLGAFMLVGWGASRTAHRAASKPAQYGALAAFVCAEAIIFVPLLFTAERTAPGAIESAAVVTLLGFAGLTGVAFWTRKDFSFLGSVLRWGFVAALVLIVAGVLFGFQLGTFFSVAMVAFAGAAILYDTSNVIHHYPEDRYVAAALELFASVALMFWYVLSLMSSD
jgi:FtsH-binding integral membrane protein